MRLYTEENATMEHHRTNTLLTLTVPQMAAELNISRNTAYELTKQPGFPCFHVGKRILVNREMLQQWLDDQCRMHA